MQLLVGSFSKKHCHSTKLLTMARTEKKRIQLNFHNVCISSLKSLPFSSRVLSI